MSDSKRLLLLCAQPPYENVSAREALDIALACAAFLPEVNVLFRGDGVWQLMENQRPEALATRPHAGLLGTLPEYGVAKLYYCTQSAAARGLEDADLLPLAQPCDTATQKELLDTHQLILQI